MVETTEKDSSEKWCFVTSHLESMKDYGHERMEQFGQLLELAKMKKDVILGNF